MTGQTEKGLLSILGESNQPFVLPTFAPAGTDLAMQMKIDLRQVESIIMSISKTMGEEKQTAIKLGNKIPELGITASDLLKKMNMTAHVLIDFRKNSVPCVGGL